MNTQMKNTLCSLLQHLCTILCGLILPREILIHYGSDMNGLVLSITRFLSYTALLELGIGAVIPAALYSPLAVRDFEKVSAILSSGYRVFRRIAGICLVYICLLLGVFPQLSGAAVSAGMILVLGAGTVLHYLVGIPESLLILSDQRGYVLYLMGTVSVLVSTALQMMLIRSGHSLLMVKFAAMLVNIGMIAGIVLYAHRHYPLRPVAGAAGEPIPQKWNGIAQHVAYFVLENADIFLLTLFASFREVSVYSVYFMVISGIRRIFQSVTGSIQPKLGELISAGEPDRLNRFFAAFELVNHFFTAAVFGGLFFFLLPFVRVYTEGVTDADYIRPVFAALLTAAYAFQCFRDPYDKLILAGGHFKQTQNNYIVGTALNLGISLAGVRVWGLEGVAAGTLVAMAYQTLYMSLYDTRKILKRPLRSLGRLIFMAAVLFLLMMVAGRCSVPEAESLVRMVLGCFK